MNQNFIDRNNLHGQIFIKNIYTNDIKEFTQQLPYVSIKYPYTVVDELSSKVLNFIMYNNTYFIQTLNYIVIDKVIFESEIYADPKTSNTILIYNTDYFNKITNFFRIGLDVYYAILSSYSNEYLNTPNVFVYPTIYKFDTAKHQNIKLFPADDSQITNIFSLCGNNIPLTDINTPRLTYTSINDLFCLSFIANNQNKIPTVYNHLFEIKTTVTFLSSYIYRLNNCSTTLSMDTLEDSVAFVLSSMEPVISSNELVY
jgi:hypothetical protein